MKWFYIIMLWLICCLAQTVEYVPKQIIFKTSAPIQITRGQTGLTQFDQFLQNYRPQSIKPVSSKSNNRYFTAILSEEPDWQTIKNSKPHFAGIEYIQPNYLNKFYITPNDPYYSNEQYYLSHIPEAWDITTGNHQVIVGLIDSGMLFDHPDLQNNVYINPGEWGVNGELKDNGTDDDGNGYIDDWRGWDFADAPELSDIGLGDYTTQDNDPTDENFHGTHVAGIVGADSNNGIGIAGINWTVRMMVLRAGFRTTEGSGYLQDDDASAALIYAADMGADVVNMSWGDANYSPIISDACQYAYDKGVILVASAGNSPEPVLSYPAQLSTVISVGAVDINKNLAGFSSFGPDLDLVAPGQDIYSTYQSSGADIYKNQSGTSMSAPFVTASIALLLSIEPGLSYEEVRSRLLMSCDDLGTPGFDNSYGNGLLNVHNFLTNTVSPKVIMTNPLDHEGLSGEFDITGTVTSPNFMQYSVMYSAVDSRSGRGWLDVSTNDPTPHSYNEPVQNGVLAHFTFPPQFSDGDYKIRIEVINTNGTTYSSIREIRIDRTPPDLIPGSLFSLMRYAAENVNYYVQAKFDEPVNLTVSCMTEFGDIYEAYSVTADSLQVVRLPETLPEGLIAIRLYAVNHSNLTYESEWKDNFLEVSYESVSGNGFEPTELGPPLVTSPNARDFDHDGNLEFIGMQLPDTGYGDVNIYQLYSNELLNKHLFYDKFWPLDLGNTSGTGTEVLGLYLDTAFLYETPDSLSYPNNFALWHDTGISGGIFANYENTNSTVAQDLILVKNLPAYRILQLYKRNPSATGTQPAFDAKNQIQNKTATSQRNTFVPKVACANLDGDTIPDILAADTDGDIMIFEVTSQTTYNMTWTARLPVPNAYYLAVGDFNGDGGKDFVVGGYQTDLINPNKTFWYFNFFTTTGNDQYASVGNISFTEVTSENSISCLDINNDGKDELLLSLSPNMYIVSYVDGKFKPIWRGESLKTYQMLAFKEPTSSNVHILVNNVNDQNVLRSYEIKASQVFTGPMTPENIRITPLNGNSVKMTWKQVDADYYQIHRRFNSIETVVGSTTSSEFVDTTLVSGNTYEFAVSSIKNSMQPNESKYSQWKEVIPNPAPRLMQIEMTASNEVKLVFDQALASEAINVGHYQVEPGIGNPFSTIIISESHGLLLRFRRPFPNDVGDFTVKLSGITGVTGVPVEMSEYTFSYAIDCIPPEVVSTEVISKNSIQVTFSESLNPEEASLAANYELIAPLGDHENFIKSVTFQDAVATINFNNNMMYTNQPYFLIISKVEDLHGNVISNHKNTARFFLTDIKDLSHLTVYPNPINLKEVNSIAFMNFPLNKDGHLKIYNISGELVYHTNIPALTSVNYTYHWDMVNNSGKKVSSGMYFYICEMGGELKKGRFAIVR